MSTTPSPSPSPNSTIINPVTDFTWVAVTYLGDTLFLLFLLTGPLLKLAKSRFAVFLIYSKCIATVLDLPVSVANMQIPLKIVQNPLTIVVRFHVLGLALNRAHSVLFPFHYSHMASKSSIIRFSLFIWAISLFVGLVAISISFAVGDVNYQILGSVRTQCNLIVASAAALIYVGMSVKLLWTKYFGAKGQSTHQQYEKDHMRIFMVCLISVIPFLLAYLSKNYLPISTCPDWVQSTVNILGAFFDSLSFIAEEVCLILISGEFRRIIGAHFQRILYGKSSSTPKNGPTKSNIMTMINVTPLTINVENRRSFLAVQPLPSVGGAVARNSARI